MSFPSRRPRPPARLRSTSFARALLCAAVTCLAAGASTAPARAEACAGVGSAPCPYASAQIIGQRAEGVLRFPEAVALDAQGDVYVADQLGYVVQKFSATGAFETEWGSYGGGHGQFGPIGGLATDAAGQRVRRRLEPQQDREVRLQRHVHHPVGPAGQRTGPVQVRLLPGLHQAARRRDRRRRQLRVRGRLRQQPHRALQPGRRGSDGMGHEGQRPRPVPLSRAASRPTPARCSSPTTTTTASRNSTRTAPTRARPARRARGPGSSASPTASRSTPRATRTSPTTSTTASSSSRPAWRSPARGAASARNPASWRFRARSRATRRATPTSRTRPTIASRCTTPKGASCARSASPRAGSAR